ncbi:MAG: hypothetical protein KAI17_23495 [Thiotrichaceae bacterium]|nr:hypothetical protein [Thiotrichaceae bacterium]
MFNIKSIIISLLIDDAVSPLIISEPRENKLLNQAITKAVELSSQLQKGRDYELEVRYKHAYLKPEGKKKIADLVLKLPAMWRGKTRSEELIIQVIAAREFYKKDQQYVIQEDKVVIVDESTGRLMPERSWSHGLHQAVEIKEGLEPSDINETIIRMSFQNFFRLFSHLSGMTGTAAESVNEFWQIYQLPVLSIPCHKKNRLSIYPEKVYQTMDEKWAAIIASVQSWHSRGRPILIGTRNVKHSEELSIRLSDLGLEHQVLNAIRHADEAGIIAHAGEFQRITIATNMAGRGTDIVLGDTIAEIGGLHVIVCERHESARIDRQLIGRCARQGDAGSAQLFSSLEDEVIQRFTSAHLIRLAYSLSTGSSGELVKKLFNYAQKKAQSQAFEQRKQVLKMDDWLADSLTFGKQANR